MDTEETNSADERVFASIIEQKRLVCVEVPGKLSSRYQLEAVFIIYEPCIACILAQLASCSSLL